MLSSPYGPAIAQMAIAGSNTHKIGQIIRRIKTQLAAPIRVEELASMANMSPSSFHQHFKAVTAMSPVQYQKRLRLTEARQILLAEKCGCGERGVSRGVSERVAVQQGIRADVRRAADQGCRGDSECRPRHREGVAPPSIGN